MQSGESEPYIHGSTRPFREQCGGLHKHKKLHDGARSHIRAWWIQLQHLGPQHCILCLECVAAPVKCHEQALSAARIDQLALEEAELQAALRIDGSERRRRVRKRPVRSQRVPSSVWAWKTLAATTVA